MEQPPDDQRRPDYQDDEDEGITESDPSEKFFRYEEVIGRGRFKVVYKGFDSSKGIDVAWSKVNVVESDLTDEQVQCILQEMSKGIALDHPNLIRVYKCWHDEEKQVINLVSELFTSGNLRQYRLKHKLEKKALVKFAKQTLKGLRYLHEHDPSVVHGDLRCDKIYVNGNKGEIKIGDLGLSSFMPAESSEGDSTPKQMSKDIVAFGLCLLELCTLHPLDLSCSEKAAEAIEEVQQEDLKELILLCLQGLLSGNDGEEVPSASELLQNSVFKHDPTPQPPRPSELGDSMIFGGLPNDAQNANGVEDIGISQYQGEDYSFSFAADRDDLSTELHFILNMAPIQSAKLDEELEQEKRRRISFTYNPSMDDADQLAKELGDQCDLTETDTQICAAAIKGWIAKILPGVEE